MPVPILLVTGFLGAGKTTVVNHLLAHAEGRRIAAVVNDFGAVNIDAELIAGASDGVVSLSNGCICCSLEGDLLRTLATLLRRDPRPEFIVIETSGIADPSDIVRNLMDPVIWQEAPLETVLCVVDATTTVESLNDALLRSQLRAADVVATKPGYGIFTEAIANDTAMLYTSRGHFVEYEVLVNAMPRYLRSQFIDQKNLLAGNWGPALEKLLSSSKPAETPDLNGAAVAADAILELI